MTLTDAQKTGLRAAERRIPDDWIEFPGYAEYCDEHESDGRRRVPEFATWRTGIVACALCDRETENSGDLCGSCLHAVEPWRDGTRL